MTPTQQGAFCNSCSKEVVDFTRITDEEVRHFFLNRTTEKTCGRFRTEQIQRIRITLPENILLQKIAGRKKFMAVLMLAFGSMLFGCDIQTNNDVILGITKLNIHKTELAGDTVLPGKKIEPVSHPIGPIIKGETSICITKDPIAIASGTEQMPPTMDGEFELVPIGTVTKPDTTGYDNVFTGNILLEKKIDTATKKPASDTSKCKETGYY